MTFCRKYVGDIANFIWQNEVLPHQISVDFPAMCPGHYGHYSMTQWAEEHGIYYVRCDFDGYVARVTKGQVESFLHDFYDTDPRYTDPAEALVWQGRAYLVEELMTLREQVAALDDTREYGLVSECC